jgi:hypothetical protein
MQDFEMRRLPVELRHGDVGGRTPPPAQRRAPLGNDAAFHTLAAPSIDTGKGDEPQLHHQLFAETIELADRLPV